MGKLEATRQRAAARSKTGICLPSVSSRQRLLSELSNTTVDGRFIHHGLNITVASVPWFSNTEIEIFVGCVLITVHQLHRLFHVE